MDDLSMNHYEQQLYSVFKSFDVNNQESLDEAAVNNLCDALQLEERGAALVDNLFERRDGRVTFSQFRSGLLAVLGEPRAASPLPAPPDPPPPLPPADGTAEAREVAPRFVFGSKQYGRRSRPQHATSGGEARAASASRAESDSPRPKYRRSASAAERRDDEPALEHGRRLARGDALALCRTLHMDTIDARIVHRIFDECGTAETTVGEFFSQLNASLGSMDEPSQCMEAERVAEAWEGAGVERPLRLLAELGLGPKASVHELERALDEELSGFESPLDARGTLLAAALALARLRAADADKVCNTHAAECDKLRRDVAEANERARLLAAEVDESHARIELELKASFKRQEAKLADEARRARAELAAERDRAEAERARAEGEAARRAEGEARLRADAEQARRRCAESEARAALLAERCAALERSAARAEERAREAEEAAAAREAEAREAAALRAHVAQLQREHHLLRDRADELAAALAAPAPPPPAPAPHPPPPTEDLSAELRSLMLSDDAQELTTGSDSVEEPTENPENQAESSNKSTCEQAETVRTVESSSEPHSPDTTAAGCDDVPEDIEEKQKLVELVKELECSLEAMRAEYDACEEYWSGKLREERRAHDGEARAAADRLADLVARIAAFERRLALPPVPEAAALEDQLAHAEAECAARCHTAARQAAAHAHRARAAERRLAAALAATAPAPTPAPAPPALAARCARAEAAVRRLHARLAAADTLVKDLYVENCHLAHHRPLPL